jgi:hypothetical protein
MERQDIMTQRLCQEIQAVKEQIPYFKQEDSTSLSDYNLFIRQFISQEKLEEFEETCKAMNEYYKGLHISKINGNSGTSWKSWQRSYT